MSFKDIIESKLNAKLKSHLSEETLDENSKLLRAIDKLASDHRVYGSKLSASDLKKGADHIVDKFSTQDGDEAPDDFYDDLKDLLGEAKEECPKCEGAGCDHCDDKGYHEESLSGAINKKLKKDKKDQADAKAKVKAKGGVIGKKDSGVSMKEETEELEEATKTFKSLEDWLMAVLDIKGASVSKMGNSLRANGLGRTQSATFELKKGRGSLLEAKKLDPVGKADADIDNDGDVDDSDEYLHNRRKSIKKSIEKAKEKKEDKKQFMYAAKTAKEDGKKEFVFAGKTYPVKEDTDSDETRDEINEASLGDHQELISYAKDSGGADRGDMLKAAALMAKGDEKKFKKFVSGLDTMVADIVMSYAD